MREHERPVRQVEHVELDEVDALRDCCAKRAERVLGPEGRRAAVTDPQHLPVAPLQVDHASRRRAERSHHHESGTRTIACPTAMAAASRETSCQNRSG